MTQKQNWFFFLILSFFLISLPILEFLNFNSYSINYLQFTNILFAYLFIVILFVLAGVAISYIKKDFNYNFFIKIIFGLYIFFNYHKLKHSLIKIKFIFTENFTYYGEISLLIILSLIFYLFKFKLKEKFIVFLFIFATLNFSYSFFLLLKKPQFLEATDKSILDKNEEIALFSPENNKEITTNIYYIIPDQAIDLKEYSKNFGTINLEQIKRNFFTKGFKYLDDVESSYNSTNLTLSQILNLNYDLNEKNNTFSTFETFPFVMTNFDETRLSKTLKLMDYKFIWFGNGLANCKNYNNSLCPKNNMKSESLISLNFISIIKNKLLYNYSVYTFFSLSPIIDSLNFIERIKDDKKFTNTNKLIKQNFSFDHFVNYYEKNPIGKKNFFLIHEIFPHPIRINENLVVFNKKCERENTGVNFNHEQKKKYPSLNVDFYGYDTNYLCFLKRLNNFLDFVNKKDPNSIIIVQADHGIPDKKFNSNLIFTLIKINENCQNFLDKEIDNINAVRLSLYCASKLKPILLKKKTFFIDKSLNDDHPDFNKIILRN